MICRRETAYQSARATYAYRGILHGKRSNNSLGQTERRARLVSRLLENMKRVYVCIHRHSFPFTVLISQTIRVAIDEA